MLGRAKAETVTQAETAMPLAYQQPAVIVEVVSPAPRDAKPRDDGPRVACRCRGFRNHGTITAATAAVIASVFVGRLQVQRHAVGGVAARHAAPLQHADDSGGVHLGHEFHHQRAQELVRQAAQPLRGRHHRLVHHPPVDAHDLSNKKVGERTRTRRTAQTTDAE